MDRPPQPTPLPSDTLLQPELAHSTEANPWGLENSEAAAQTKSLRDIRDIYLKWRERMAAAAAAQDPSKLKAIARRLYAWLPSRRIVAGAAVVVLVAVLGTELARRDVAPSITTLAGATYNTALDGLASAVSAGLDLVGLRAGAAEAVPVTPPAKAPAARVASERRGPITSSRAVPLAPLVNGESIQANGPAALVDTEIDDTIVPADAVPALLPVYSSNDAEIIPPVAMRSPGIATGRSDREAKVLMIEVLVNEHGTVESVRGGQRPSTIGAALQANMALSVVRTWRFKPARKDGQPVRYRTTVPFVETMNVARD